MFNAFKIAISTHAPTIETMTLASVVTAAKPSIPASTPPSQAPTMPTTLLAMAPSWPFGVITRLASQPINAPMSRLMLPQRR